MSSWLATVLGVLAGLVLLWLVLVALLWREQRRQGDITRLRDALRLVPDVIRLVRRLVADPAVPRGTRIWLGVLLVYLISPIDLIPDFIPVLGYADDALIIAFVLRLAIRYAGREAVTRHWPGTEAGLRTVLALTRNS